MNARAPHALTTLALCLGLAACGSGGGDTGSTTAPPDIGAPASRPATTGPEGSVSDPITRFGTLNIDETSEDGLSVTGAFYRLSTPLAGLPFDTATPAPGEECDVLSRAEYDAGTGVPPELDPSRLAGIGAGQAIVLTTPNGTWGELTRFDLGLASLYLSVDGIGSTLPASLLADVPGGEFPAFANVAVPDTTTLRDFERTRDGAGWTFTWEAGDDGAGIGIVLLGDTDVVDCAVPDTGRFTLPAAAARALAEDVFVDVRASRVASTLTRAGDSLLLVAVTREALDAF